MQPFAWGDLDDAIGFRAKCLDQIERRLDTKREQLPLHDLPLNRSGQLLKR
ncbi:uncharacterized protein METZ01_LOCUS226169 [marine metagenome]|uniref:Uncharacterized protein n=1 Tax=marine metagenome TaxID=408172 RepID=A0A382GF04_9ZZZZ